MDDVEILSFGIGDYSRGDRSCRLLRRDGDSYLMVAERTYTSFLGRETESRETELTAGQVQDFLEAADSLGVFGWSGRYMAQKMDGSDWDLAIRAQGYPELKSRGYSAKPDGFDDFVALLSDMGFQA